MYLGRVIGCVWSTMKDPALSGMRMLVVQPLTPELENTGKRIICTDCTGAGAGEIIYWVRGREASFPFRPAEPPTDTTIVGIVDSVHLQRHRDTAGGGAPAPDASSPGPANSGRRGARKRSPC